MLAEASPLPLRHPVKFFGAPAPPGTATARSTKTALGLPSAGWRCCRGPDLGLRGSCASEPRINRPPCTPTWAQMTPGASSLGSTRRARPLLLPEPVVPGRQPWWAGPPASDTPSPAEPAHSTCPPTPTSVPLGAGPQGDGRAARGPAAAPVPAHKQAPGPSDTAAGSSLTNRGSAPTCWGDGRARGRHPGPQPTPVPTRSLRRSSWPLGCYPHRHQRVRKGETNTFQPTA